MDRGYLTNELYEIDYCIIGLPHDGPHHVERGAPAQMSEAGEVFLKKIKGKR